MSGLSSIDALEHKSRAELISLWRIHVSASVPKKISQRLLIATIAFELQLKASSTSSRKTIKAIKRQANAPFKSPSAEPIALHQSGTRLLREWNGKTHIVDITDDGCHWNGQTYRSLSAVACAITGAHWSGPRFFKSCARYSAKQEALQ